MRKNDWRRTSWVLAGFSAALLGGALFFEYRLDGVSRQLQRSREDLSESRRSLYEIQSRARDLQRQMESFRERCAVSENALEQLSVREGELRGRLEGDLRAAEARIRGEVRAVVEDARTRLDVLTGTEERLIGRLGSVEGSVDRLAAAETEHGRGIDRVRRLVDHDKDRLHASILHTAVQVNGKGGVGGGIVLYSRPDGDRGALTCVLTAYHVIHRSITTQDGKEVREPIVLRLYDEAGASLQEHSAELVSYDSRQDIALLRLWLPKPTPHVARIASKEAIRGVRVFTPIYAVGCPLGHDPMPTLGQVASLRKEVNGGQFWMMNAPTIFGNSGGGIFLTDTLELVGISSMICTYDQFISMPVPHLGILVPFDRIYEWFDAQCMQYVYDASVSREECDRRRSAAREKDPEVVRVTWD